VASRADATTSIISSSAMTFLVWLHLVGAAIWLGGLVTLAVTVLVALRTLPRPEFRALVRRVGWAFAALSAAAWLSIGVSGVVLAGRLGWPAPIRIKAVLGAALVAATLLHVLTGRLTASRLAVVASRTLALLVFLGTLAVFWLGVQVAAST
jgi:putative copper resistance protein D